MTNLESKVTSLILSRKLDAAFKGIKPPESEFWWNRQTKKLYSTEEKVRLLDTWGSTAWYPAYLSDELLEGMPDYLLSSSKAYKEKIRLISGGSGDEDHVVNNKSLPNACGEMKIWLIDNGYWI